MNQTAHIAGDPWGETAALEAIQSILADKPGVLSVARGMSHFGEHALGWFVLAGAGYLADRRPGKREEWIGLGVSAFTAHAASVVLKRIVRRPRPHDPRVQINVATPSKLSFPSSHATSSTAALVSLAALTDRKAPLLGVPAMALSRMVLGVHYPTDVAAGSLIGWATATAVRCCGVGKK